MSDVSVQAVAKPSRRRLAYWQAITLLLLVVGYAGYYLCRSDLSVTLPLIADDLASRGLPAGEVRIRLGGMVSLGVLAYAIGKLLLAGVADFFGGRKNFLGGMAGAVLFTFLFAAGTGLPILTLCWIGNRLTQSAGWAGMVKIASRWFSYSSYGMVMGVLSLSYLFGDAAARQFMGILIGKGVGWRGVFAVAGGTLLFLLLLNLGLLRESRTEIGEAEPAVNPLNLFATEDATDPPRVGRLLATLLASPGFWCVCFLSLGSTLVRETLNLWTPTYLHDGAGFGGADAAKFSAVFPFFGGLSVLAAGYLGDRFGILGRSQVMTAGFFFSALALAGLAMRQQHDSPMLAVALISLVAFGLIGPYSYLAGAVALDFGGRRGSGLASGLIDFVGYLGGALAGDTIARISVRFGWQAAFASLAATMVLVGICAGGLWMRGRAALVRTR